MSVKDHSRITIFSLTDNGQRLGQQLLSVFPDAEHLHKPSSLIEKAQQVFSMGQQCIFICSTGIVMRALAPVFRDKYSDPAVLVIDELGLYVIPLLSGHEGGSCALGRLVAEAINAQLVITSATDYSQPIYCVGFGSDRGCPTEMISALYDEAIDDLAEISHSIKVDIVQLSSIDLKQDEAGMLALANRLALPFACYSAETLRSVENQLSEKSEIVFREVGCYGVAEAAALVGATAVTGNPAELVITKRKNFRATISVARSYR